MEAPDIHAARAASLGLAVALWEDRDSSEINQDVLRSAGDFMHWLLPVPARIKLTPGPFTFNQGVPGPGTPTQGGNNMPVSMTDAQQVPYSAAAQDERGFAASDSAFTWSESSGGTVVTAEPSADSLSCLFVAVAPGSATVSVTDGTLSAEDTIDVVAGAPTQILLTPGTPEDIPAPAAAAEEQPA